MKLQITSLEPNYRVNYNVGYIGFTFRNKNIISEGIAYFTRWQRLSDIKVSHVLVVSGKNKCVEALAKGVKETKLTDYFNDPHTQIFFRKPLGYSRQLGQRIASAAKKQLGKKYDKWLIAAHMLHGSFLGRWVNGIFDGKPDLYVSRLLNHKDKWICSELASFALDSQPEFTDKGVLEKPDFTIDPQQLFEDQTIFTPWHKTKPKEA